MGNHAIFRQRGATKDVTALGLVILANAHATQELRDYSANASSPPASRMKFYLWYAESLALALAQVDMTLMVLHASTVIEAPWVHNPWLWGGQEESIPSGLSWASFGSPSSIPYDNWEELKKRQTRLYRIFLMSSEKRF